MKKLFIAIMIVFSAFAAFSQTGKPVPEMFFTPEQMQRVLDGEIISRMCIAGNAWGENTDLTMTIPATSYDAGGYTDWEMICDEKAFIPFELNDENKLKLLNILTDFESLKGAKYYSRKVDEILVLIEDAYRMKSATNHIKAAPAKYDKLESHVTNYFSQKDNRFGRTFYQSDVWFDGDDIIMINSNVVGMAYLVPINRKGEFKSITYLMYSAEHKGFFYYTANPIRIRIELALKKLSPTTFAQRLRAMTVHYGLAMGADWSDKYQPYDNEKLSNGEYRNY